jgi:hypothetical protein
VDYLERDSQRTGEAAPCRALDNAYELKIGIGVAGEMIDLLAGTRAQVSGRGELHPPALAEPRREGLPSPGSHRPTLGARDQCPVSEELRPMLANSVQPGPRS